MIPGDKSGASRSQADPSPAVAAPQEKSEARSQPPKAEGEEEAAAPGDGNLFEGDVLDMHVPAPLAPGSSNQGGTAVPTLDRDLPWMMSALNIRSPVLRLHNGGPYCSAFPLTRRFVHDVGLARRSSLAE